MMAYCFAGYSEKEVRTFAAEVARASGLRERLHAEVLPIVAWAARRGIPRYVVSASHAAVVASSIEQVGLFFDGIFAMERVRRRGRFFGAHRGTRDVRCRRNGRPIRWRPRQGAARRLWR